MNIFKKLFSGAANEIEDKKNELEEKKSESKEKDFDILKYDGLRALRTGQYDYAIKCFRHALDIKDDLEVHDYLSQALIRNNELLAAYKELEVLAVTEPDNQDILIRMAQVAFMNEDYDAMGENCKKALEINKTNPLVYVLYARAFRGSGDYVNALAMVNEAIKLDAQYIEAHELRGNILLDMNDTDGADNDAQWLLENTNDDEDVYLFKARVERAKENYKEAIHYYNKVTEVNPFRIEAFRERGAVKLATGDKDGADEDGRKLLELNPNEK